MNLRTLSVALLAGAAMSIGLSRASAAELEPMAWLVKPDPATAPASATNPATAPANIQIKPRMSLVHQTRSSQDLVAPTRPSKFVLSVARHGDQGWDLWDLSAGVRVKNGSGKIPMDSMALSPDGQYVAGTRRGSGAGDAAGVEIWSIKNFKIVCRIEGTGRGNEPRVLGFAGSDRVLVLQQDDKRQRMIHICDVATGATKAQFPAAAYSETVMLSPGGAYAAIHDSSNHVLTFYSTQTGEGCGRIILEDFGQDDRSSRNDFSHMAFWANGKEMALFFGRGSRLRIATYDVATAKKTSEFAFAGKLDRDAGGFEYLPDGSGWLAYPEVINRAAQAVVYTFPKVSDVCYARAATAEEVLQVVQDYNKLTFTPASIPKGAIERAVAALKVGGKTEDANLQPLAKADISSAKAVSMEASNQAWLVKPANVAATRAAPKGVKSIPIKPHFPAAAGQSQRGSLTAVLFAGQEANSVVIQQSLQDGYQINMPPKSGWVEKYDLASGNLQAEVELAPLMDLQDVSPSGEIIACRTGIARDRVDLFKLDKRTYRPLVAFRPPADEAKPSPYTDSSLTYQISSVMLVDEAHVLVAGRRELVLWELPSCKAVWRMPLPGDVVRCGISLSPDRKLAATSARGGVVVFETLTGKALNVLPIDSTPATAQSVAFSPDGTQLAALLQHRGAQRLHVYDLQSGAVAADVPLPSREAGAFSGGPIRFASKGNILVGSYLINTQKKALVWRYAAAIVNHGDKGIGSHVPHEGGWFIAPRVGNLPMALVHVPLPHAAAAKFIETFDSTDQYVWCPGMKVSLNVSVVGDEQFRKQQVEQWKTQLKAVGFEVVDNAPNVITASSFLMDGPSTTYQTGNEKFTVARKVTGWKIALWVGGKEAWKSEYATPPKDGGGPNIMFLNLKPGESAQQAADRMHPPPTTASHVETPPPYIFRERTIESSSVNARGLEEVARPK